MLLRITLRRQLRGDAALVVVVTQSIIFTAADAAVLKTQHEQFSNNSHFCTAQFVLKKILSCIEYTEMEIHGTPDSDFKYTT